MPTWRLERSHLTKQGESEKPEGMLFAAPREVALEAALMAVGYALVPVKGGR